MSAIDDRKTSLFRQALQRGIEPAPGARASLTDLWQTGIGVAVASPCEHCAAILHAIGLYHLIDQRVDGIDAHKLRLPSKPDPPPVALGVQPLRAIAPPCSRTPW